MNHSSTTSDSSKVKSMKLKKTIKYTVVNFSSIISFFLLSFSFQVNSEAFMHWGGGGGGAKVCLFCGLKQ